MNWPRPAAAGALAVALFGGSALLDAPPLRHATCPIREEPPAPGPPAPPLTLGLGPQGRVGSMSVDADPLPRLEGPSGFSVRLAGGNPNLLANGGFEADADGDGAPDGWTLGPEAIVKGDGPAHRGRRSVRVESGRTATVEAFAGRRAVRPGTLYVLTAWIRSEEVHPIIPPAVREPTDPHSPVQVQVSNGAGPPVAVLYGATGTAGWHRASVGFRAGPGVTEVAIRGVLLEGSGSVWFDDVSLAELFAPSDVAVEGRAVRDGVGFRYQGHAPGEGVALSAALRPVSGAVRVDGAVRASGPRERAMTVAFTLPVDATGWTWGDDARRSRSITEGRYASETTSSLQATSRYPFAAISGDRAGVGVGIPLDEPRIFRASYETGRGLRVEFDLGTSPSATRLGPEAGFSFVVFAFDPAWGFRAAIERYVGLFPEAFTRRTDPRCEGAWFAAPPLYGLDPEGFGLGLNMIALGKASSQRHGEWGTRYLRFDNAAGIYASAYTHQWAHYRPYGHGPQPAYDEVVAGLRAEAAAPGTDPASVRRREEAAAALRSTARDVNGRLLYERWGLYHLSYQNLDPDPAGPDWSGAAMEHQVLRALALAEREGGRLDGIHLDSTSGMRRWGAADDHARRHWALATLPLTFSYDSGLVAVRGVFPLYGHLSRTAGFLHRRGMLLSANFNGDTTRTLGFVGADRIDYFGLEQGLVDRATEEAGLDEFALLKRTLAYQRPLSTLDHQVGLGRLDAEEIDRRLQQNVFYGIFAGAYNFKIEADGGASFPTWSTPEHRELWSRYVPALRRLAAAGWEPVTLARSSDPAVWVERFGRAEDGDLHLTLHNPTGTGRTVRVRLETRAGAGALELLTGERVEVAASGDAGRSVELMVPARSTRVLTFPSS